MRQEEYLPNLIKPPNRYTSKIPKGKFEAHEDIFAPLVKPEPQWRGAVTLVGLGLFAAWFDPINVLLPLQVSLIDPHNREMTLSLVIGIGAIASMFSNPFIGALSDHTTNRYGRRAPWVMLGTVVGVFGLVCVAASWKVWALIFSWALTQISLNSVFAAIMATPNDRVDTKYRGEMAGWMTSGQNLGALLGIVVSALYVNIVAGYVACITLLCVSVIPYLWNSRDRYIPPSNEPYRMKNFFTRFLISPRKYPDFAWAWLARFVFLIPLNIVLIYLLYYLQDVIQIANPKLGLLMLSGIFAALTTIVSLMTGLISDYKARRKLFIIIAGVIAAAGCLILGITHCWTGALIASIALGIGYGLFIPTHFAVATMVLPSSEETARDLGILNIAAALPQVVAPLIAMPFLSLIQNGPLGYSLIFTVCAMLFLAGGLSILPVKTVK